jgi:hypothetical protein
MDLSLPQNSITNPFSNNICRAKDAVEKLTGEKVTAKH